MSAFHPSRLCLCEHFPLPQANELSISARCDLLQPFRPVAFQEETQLNKKPLTTGFRPQCLGKEPHRKGKTGWKMTCFVGRGKLSCQALHSVPVLLSTGDTRIPTPTLWGAAPPWVNLQVLKEAALTSLQLVLRHLLRSRPQALSVLETRELCYQRVSQKDEVTPSSCMWVIVPSMG